MPNKTPAPETIKEEKGVNDLVGKRVLVPARIFPKEKPPKGKVGWVAKVLGPTKSQPDHFDVAFPGHGPMYFFPESELRTWKIIQEGVPDEVAASADDPDATDAKKSKRKRKSGEAEEEEEPEWVDDEEEEEEEEEEEIWIEEESIEEEEEEEEEEDSLAEEVEEETGEEEKEKKEDTDAKKGGKKRGPAKEAAEAANGTADEKVKEVAPKGPEAVEPSGKLLHKRTFGDIKGGKEDEGVAAAVGVDAGAGPSAPTEIEVPNEGEGDDEERPSRKARTDAGPISTLKKTTGEVLMAAVGVAAAYLALQQVSS